MNHTNDINVSWSIPKINLDFSSRQNRHLTGDITIIPGITQMIKLNVLNPDGYKLSLVGLRTLFCIYTVDFHNTMKLEENSEVLYKKEMLIDNPHTGELIITIDAEDSLKFDHYNGALRWTIYFINSENKIFVPSITNNNGKFGNIIIDNMSGIPSINKII